jgi:hypothetical protein
MISKKIITGINNITLVFWFAVMICCGGSLAYLSFSRNLFMSDVIFITKFFIGLIILFTVGLICFIIIRFRILIITKSKVISIKPFMFNYQQIDFNNIKAYKWVNLYAFKTTFREIKIKQKKGKQLTFSDCEFENFDRLVEKLPNSGYSPEKASVALEQAKAEFGSQIFSVISEICLLAVIVCLNIIKIYHWIHLIGYAVLSLLLYVSVRKSIKYHKIKKNNKKEI